MNVAVWDRRDAFVARAAGRLRPVPPDFSARSGDLRGDHSLDGHAHPETALPPLRQAAVLVPIVMRPEGATVLLTERAAHLRHHSGQIAFPGGKMDPGDRDALATALREAEEEISLAPRHVTPIGYLDPYLSSSNFFVVPAVATVAADAPFAPNPDEVADAFEVPLAFLMDERHHELHCRRFRGQYRQYYAMPFGERYIWGVTAGILRNLYERLYGEEDA